MPDKPYYLTTPIYYVNDVPHIGTAYTTVLADVTARYRRALGQKVFFLTGTDEHGQKAADAAAARGLDAKTHCDELQQRFRDAWKRLSIGYDDFVRTTEPRHEKVVQTVLSALHERGELYTADYEGWYDVSAEVFVTEKEIEEEGLDRTKLKRFSERNWWFRMGKYRDAIVEAVSSQRLCISPESRKNEVLGFLKKDLGDLCISRPKARLSWGIPLPFDPEYVTYVWFDALLNYASVPGLSGDPKDPFRSPWPADVHLLGKDILTTHSVYWPAMLLSFGAPLPKRILAHGWWLLKSEKISKSKGNVIDPLGYVDTYGADALRYFLMREMVVGQDAEFSDERFRARYEGELANEWGNLQSRTLTMIGKFAGGSVPTPEHEGGGASPPRDLAEKSIALLDGALDSFAFHEVCAHAMSVLRAANVFIDREQPWKAAKDPAKAGRVRDVLYTLAEALRHSAALLSPVLPTKGAEALSAWGQPPATDLRTALRWGTLPAGVAVAPGAILFPKLDPAAGDRSR